MRVVLLHNPFAGNENHSAEELERLIGAAGHELVAQAATEEGWERVLEQPADLVAIAGGDGTVGEVLRELASHPPRTATVLPLGSANNIARIFGLDRDPRELIAGWKTATRSRFRVGEVTAADQRSTFLEAVGGGLFAEVLARAEGTDADRDDKVEHGLRLLLELVEELPAEPWQVELDGNDHSGDYLAVEALVIGETGPRIPLAPAADPEDHCVDVVLITDPDRAQLAAYLDARIKGDTTPLALTVHRSRVATLRPPPAHRLRIDDELWPSDWALSPADDIRIHTNTALDVLVPPTSDTQLGAWSRTKTHTRRDGDGRPDAL